MDPTSAAPVAKDLDPDITGKELGGHVRCDRPGLVGTGTVAARRGRQDDWEHRRADAQRDDDR